MPPANIYSLLGVGYDADETAVKRAYAALIKQYRPDSHPAEFAEIRAAYEEAVRRCRERLQWEAWEDEDSQQPEAAQPAAQQEPDHAPPQVQATRPAEMEAEPIAAPAQLEDGPHGMEAAPPAHQPGDARVTVTFADADMAEPAFDLPARSVAAMIAELEEHAGEEGEAGMLERYRTQAVELAAMPLDQQMDYEQALCRWLLFAEHPSLLVFREANRRYGWADNSAQIAREYGSHAAKRATAMQELAEAFAGLRDAHSPYLSLDGKADGRAPRLAWHYRVMRAKQQAAAWKIECDNAGLPVVARRVAYAPRRALQVFWLDAAIALLAAWLVWLPDGADIYRALWAGAAGAAILFAPALVRAGMVSAAPAWSRMVRGQMERLGADGPRAGMKAVWGMRLVKWAAIAATLYLIVCYPFLLVAAGAVAVAVLLYLLLAYLEAAAIRAAVRLARFPAWLMGLPEARRKTGSWRAALGLNRLAASFRREASFSRIPWWVWMVAAQIILAIARGARS